MEDDIIRALLRMVRTVATGVPDTEWKRLEAQAKREFGGQRFYVPQKTDGPSGKMESLAGALAAGVPVREAFVMAGVSRSWGYTLLRRRWPIR